MTIITVDNKEWYKPELEEGKQCAVEAFFVSSILFQYKLRWPRAHCCTVLWKLDRPLFAQAFPKYRYFLYMYMYIIWEVCSCSVLFRLLRSIAQKLLNKLLSRRFVVSSKNWILLLAAMPKTPPKAFASYNRDMPNFPLLIDLNVEIGLDSVQSVPIREQTANCETKKFQR